MPRKSTGVFIDGTRKVKGRYISIIGLVVTLMTLLVAGFVLRIVVLMTTGHELLDMTDPLNAVLSGGLLIAMIVFAYRQLNFESIVALGVKHRRKLSPAERETIERAEERHLNLAQERKTGIRQTSASGEAEVASTGDAEDSSAA